jgi:hypothetical protein
MQFVDPPKIQQFYGTQVTLKGGYAREGYSKGRKAKT